MDPLNRFIVVMLALVVLLCTVLAAPALADQCLNLAGWRPCVPL